MQAFVVLLRCVAHYEIVVVGAKVRAWLLQ
jgi:hypothetical protein